MSGLPFRYEDTEGYVHFRGPAQAVNIGLCGNNDEARASVADADCAACLAIVAYVKSNGRVG